MKGIRWNLPKQFGYLDSDAEVARYHDEALTPEQIKQQLGNKALLVVSGSVGGMREDELHNVGWWAGMASCTVHSVVEGEVTDQSPEISVGLRVDNGSSDIGPLTARYSLGELSTKTMTRLEGENGAVFPYSACVSESDSQLLILRQDFLVPIDCEEELAGSSTLFAAVNEPVLAPA